MCFRPRRNFFAYTQRLFFFIKRAVQEKNINSLVPVPVLTIKRNVFTESTLRRFQCATILQNANFSYNKEKKEKQEYTTSFFVCDLNKALILDP